MAATVTAAGILSFLRSRRRANAAPGRRRPPLARQGATCWGSCSVHARSPRGAGEYKSAPDDGWERSATEGPEIEIEIERRVAAVTGAGGLHRRRGLPRACRTRALRGDRRRISPGLDEQVGAAGATPRLADITDPARRPAALDGRRPGRAHGGDRAGVGRDAGVHRGQRRAARRTSSTRREAAGAERVVHLSSVVVYGYADRARPGRVRAPPRRRDPLHRHQERIRPARRAAGRGHRQARRRLRARVGALGDRARRADARAGGRASRQGRRASCSRSTSTTSSPGSSRRCAAASPGQAYTVWDGEPTRFDRYFELLAAEIPGATPPRKLPKPLLHTLGALTEGVARLQGKDPPFGRHGVTLTDRRGTASNKRAMEELDWKPKVTLAEGVRRSGKWLLEAQRA